MGDEGDKLLLLYSFWAMLKIIGGITKLFRPGFRKPKS